MLLLPSVILVSLSLWTRVVSVSVTAYSDQVILDKSTFQVRDNSSSYNIAENFSTPQGFLVTDMKAEYNGILVGLDYLETVGSLEGADQIALIPVYTRPQIVQDLARVSNPNIKAIMIFPYLASLTSDRYSSVKPLVKVPVFFIPRESGLYLTDQLKEFNQNPSDNTTTNGTTDSFQRLWSRIYYLGLKETLKESKQTDLGLILGCTAAGIAVLLGIIALCLCRRYRQTLGPHRNSKKDGSQGSRRSQGIKRLLALPVKSKRAPPISSGQLRQLAVIKINKSNHAMFPLAGRQAVQRFQEHVPDFRTSSDEDSDSEMGRHFFRSPLSEKYRASPDLLRSPGLTSDLPVSATTPVNYSLNPEPTREKLKSGGSESDGDGQSGDERIEMTPQSEWSPKTPTSNAVIASTSAPGSPGGSTSQANTSDPFVPPIMARMMDRNNEVEWANFKKNQEPLTGKRSRSNSKKPEPIILPPSPSLSKRFSNILTPNTAVTQGGLRSPWNWQRSPGNPLSPQDANDRLNASASSLRRVLCQQPMQGEPVCGVCNDEFREGESARRLPCYHIFHPECVDAWLTRKTARCPLCKTNCTPKSTMDESTLI
ncbi:hypothetical protein H4R33_000809 [Dimargaris cristalligena]|nr:hypothetical protein H4R33_000809 [Dimargaris cristalligena]